MEAVLHSEAGEMTYMAMAWDADIGIDMLSGAAFGLVWFGLIELGMVYQMYRFGMQMQMQLL